MVFLEKLTFLPLVVKIQKGVDDFYEQQDDQGLSSSYTYTHPSFMSMRGIDAIVQ